MQKARSRLQPAEPEINPQINHQLTPHPAAPLRLKNYFSHLPTLFFSLGCWWVIFHLVTTVHPQAIKNWLIPDSYLLFLGLFFLANFFTWSFVVLNSRRGAIVALSLTSLMFLKLQRVILNPLLIMLLAIGWLVILLINELIFRLHHR